MSGRRRTTCVPVPIPGGGVALVRGSFTENEVAAMGELLAAARSTLEAQLASGVSDPPATVPGAPATTTLGDTVSSYDLNIETAPETGGDKFVNAEHEGELIVLAVKSTGKDTFDNGEAEFIVADITIVEGPNAGEQFEDAWLFGRVLFGQLKRKIGRTFVGRIVKGQAQKGKSAPWQLDPVDAETTTRAVEFMKRLIAEQSTPPAATSGGAPAEGPAPTEVGDSDAPPWARK